MLTIARSLCPFAAPAGMQRHTLRRLTAMPKLQLLSNGTYHVLFTEAGHAYSRWNDIAVTRWRADETLDDGGARCYIRDHTSRSDDAGPAPPVPLQRTAFGSDFQHGRARIWGNEYGIETRSEMAVSALDPVELRRVVVKNWGNRPSTLSATSYAEIVLSLHWPRSRPR
jgi:cyclic beta-1,2-glucan synthetase